MLGPIVTGAACHGDVQQGYQKEEGVTKSLRCPLATEGRDGVANDKEEGGDEIGLMAATMLQRSFDNVEVHPVYNMSR